MLSAEEIASMTDVLLSALDQSVNVQRAPRTADGSGGFTESWANATTVYSAMPCRIKRLPGVEGVIAEQIVGRVHKQLLFPTTYTLLHKDRIVQGSTTYQLVANPASTSYGRLLGVEIEQIEEQG